MAKDNKDDGVAQALQKIADSLLMLGNAGTSTPGGTQFGGLEGHGMAILEAADKIAVGLEDVASAIRELAAARK